MKSLSIKINFIAFMLIIPALAISQNITAEFDLFNRGFSDGDIICSDNHQLKGGEFYISKASYDDKIIGVYYNDNPDSIVNIRLLRNPIKIMGVVPVKYSDKNGPIKKGDPITTSSLRGVGMKAIKSGMILGIAIEDANEELVKIRISVQYIYINK